MVQAREDRALADPHPNGANEAVSLSATHIRSEAWIEWSAARNCDGCCFVYHMKAVEHNSWPCSYHANDCAPLGHATRHPQRRTQNGESGNVLPSGRGLAALLAAGVPDGRGKTWPCTRPHRRRRPARTRPCIPHAPKTLRNRALPIFGEVPAACTNPKMTGFWPAKMPIW